jgi:hypothetical protein
MNLHSVASAAIGSVNPNITGQLKVSTGYDTSVSGARVPQYAATVDVPIQVQSLSSREIEHIDSLNIQNVTRAAYLYGNVQGLDRAAAKGGDLLRFGGKVWLVAVVLETWPTWCKVGLAAQTDWPN